MYFCTFFLIEDIEVAAIAGYLSGMVISLLGANFFVFDNPEFTFLSKKVVLQVIVHVLGMFMLSVLVAYLYLIMQFGVSTSWILAAIPTAALNYIGLKFVTEGWK